MTYAKLAKSILSILFVFFILIGLGFMGFEYLLYGEGRATFYGYQLSSATSGQDTGLYQIGNFVVIKSPNAYEIHNNTPIALYDKNSKMYYIYRVVCKDGANYTVIDDVGTLITVDYEDIAGRVLEA